VRLNQRKARRKAALAGRMASYLSVAPRLQTPPRKLPPLASNFFLDFRNKL